MNSRSRAMHKRRRKTSTGMVAASQKVVPATTPSREGGGRSYPFGKIAPVPSRMGIPPIADCSGALFTPIMHRDGGAEAVLVNQRETNRPEGPAPLEDRRIIEPGLFPDQLPWRPAARDEGERPRGGCRRTRSRRTGRARACRERDRIPHRADEPSGYEPLSPTSALSSHTSC